MNTTDLRRIVDDIQTMLTSPTPIPLEAVHAVSLELIEAYEAMNQRLRQCQDLLRRGLRAEALQLADNEPKLIDSVAILDFSDMPRWMEWLQGGEMLQPPRLLTEVAGELNEAYAQERPLASLMRNHRMLALARAPLRHRITNLRKIASADPNSAIWGEDLQVWERARHEQIRIAAQAAERNNDAAAFVELEQELNEKEWREPPPQTLVANVATKSARIRGQRARSELKRLETDLTAAHGEFDLTRGRRIRDEWNRWSKGLSASDPLAEMAAPALAWLDDEDAKEQLQAEFADKTAALEQALNDELPVPVLERCYNELLQLNLGMDENLANRFAIRVEEHHLAKARRFRLTLVGVAAVFLLAAGLTGYFLLRHSEQQIAEGYVAALERAVDDKKLDEAGGIIGKIEQEPAYIKGDPRIVSLQARYEGLRNDEQQRLQRFDQALARARQDLIGAKGSGSDFPNRSQIDELRKLAQSDVEHTSAATLDADVGEWQRTLQKTREDAFLARANELADKIKKVEMGDLLGYATRLNAAETLLLEADVLVKSSGQMPPAVGSVASALRERLNATRATEQEALREVASLQKVTNAVGDVDKFREAMNGYIQQFPTKKRALEFRRLLDDEAEAWRLVAAWNKFVDMNGRKNFTSLSPEASAAMISECQTLLTNHAGFPGVEALRLRLPYLEAAKRRVDAGAPLTDGLKAAFDAFIVAQLYSVRIKGKDGKELTYYSTDPIPPVGENSRLAFKYLTGTDSSAPPKSKNAAKEEVVEKSAGDAPQSVAAKSAWQVLKSIKEGEWESKFSIAVQQMQANTTMDPIIKIQLLMRMMSVASEGSVCLQKVFAPHVELWQNANLNVLVNWIDPTNPEAEEVRREASKLLKDMPPLDAAIKLAGEEFRQLSAPPLDRKYDWLGWLVLDTTGRWNCRTPQVLASGLSGELCVVKPAGPDTPASLETIGALTNGKFDWTAAKANSLVEGRPVFLVRPTAVAK